MVGGEKRLKAQSSSNNTILDTAIALLISHGVAQNGAKGKTQKNYQCAGCPK